MLNDPNKLWLVKSSGRILGPMNREEIENSLRSKELVVLDEVSRPFGRWKYIRDEDTFEKIVLELKNRDHVQTETTITGTVSLNTVTSTDIIEGNTVTPIPQNKVFEVSTDPRKWNKTLQLLLILIILASFFLWLKDKDLAPQGFEQIKENAEYFNSIGDYESAKSEYEKALKIKSDDNNLQLELAALLIHFQDTVSAKRILEGLLNSNLGNSFNYRVHNLMGIIYLYHYSFKEALDSFSKALATQSDYSAALFNKGMSHFFLKDLVGAEANFYKILKNNSSNAISIIMLAQVHSQQREYDRAHALIGIIDEHVKYEVPYYQELNITKAYLLYVAKKYDSAQAIIETILDSDPDLTQDNVFDLNYYQEKNMWSYLVQWLIEMKRDLKPSARLDALLGYAMFKNKEKIEGRGYIENALKLNPADTLLSAVSSYTNSALERDEDANAALMVALQKNEFQLPHILKARLCKKSNDLVCQETQWQTVLQINPHSISAIYGIAEVNVAQNNFLEAKKNIDMGLGMSPHYGPLLKLKKVLDDKVK